MMLKLKLQYFGLLTWRVDSLEKTLMLGGIGGRRRRGQPRMWWLDGIKDSMDVSLSEFRELVLDREAWRAAIHGVTKSWTWLNDWTELNWCHIVIWHWHTLWNNHYNKSSKCLSPYKIITILLTIFLICHSQFQATNVMLLLNMDVERNAQYYTIKKYSPYTL